MSIDEQLNSFLYYKEPTAGWRQDLNTFLGEHGKEGAVAIATFLAERRDSEFVSDVLAMLGDSDDAPSRPLRLDILHGYLTHASRMIRYGAAIGLVDLNDPASLAPLSAALEDARAESHLARDSILVNCITQAIDYIKEQQGK